MTIVKGISSREAQVWDYSKVDSKTLLREAVKTHEALYYAWAVLLVQASLLSKEVIASGMSESARHIEAQGKETLQKYRMWREELKVIESEIVRRVWDNKTNGYFGKLKIGLLRNDGDAQDEAMQNLYRIFGSIPWKKGWFHPERRAGIDSLTNHLVAEELAKYEHLSLPTTLEYAMNNKFAYLHVAYERDFLDEIDKYRRRPFERYLEPGVIVDESDGSEGQAEEVQQDGEWRIIDNIDRERRVIRLRDEQESSQ